MVVTNGLQYKGGTTILPKAIMSEKLPGNIGSQEYNKGVEPDMDMKVEFAINDRLEAIIFHDKPFEKDLSWLEFDLGSNKLDFVMEDGDVRNFGIPIDPKLAKHMQNAFQILMVLKDYGSGEPVEGGYFPLILHKD